MVFSGAESERVNVDTKVRLDFKVLVGLDIVEVSAITNLEAVLTVELNLSLVYIANGVSSIGKASELVANISCLNSPANKLGGVVKGEANAVVVGARNGGFLVLGNFDEVFVGLLGEFLAFFGIKEDVVSPEFDIGEGTVARARVKAVSKSFELDPEFDFVVLKSN